MIILTKNITSKIFCTPLENTTNSLTIFKFVFTNRITKDIVNFWGTNISTTKRYQLFEIVVNTYFTNYDTGMWDYIIYGASTIGGMPTTDSLENGYMYLKNNDTFIPESYNGQSNTFVTYKNG